MNTIVRVALAKMLVRPAAFLCMDEPTNHLDLASREVLERALAAFPGTIVFISHDRYFINRIVTGIVDIACGSLVSYPGSYDDYLDAKARAAAAPAGTARGGAARNLSSLSGSGPRHPAPSPPVRPERARASEARARPATREMRELRKRLEEVERQIHALEAQLAEIGTRLGDPALYADGERVRAAANERKRAEEQVTWLMREWEQLSTALAAHE